MNKYVRITVAAALVIMSLGGVASAAAVRSGTTIGLIAGFVRGTAVAYDPLNKVYLVVGANGVLRGRFVKPDGTPLGAQFEIQANPATFAHFPRVAFSPDADGGAGGFLVTWHCSDLPGGNTSIHGRMVSLGKGGAFGTDTVAATEGSWWEAGAAVAYSTASKEFMVAWRRGAAPGIRAMRLDNTATPKAAMFAITDGTQFVDNPSIAYNPTTDEFIVVCAGFNTPGNFAFVDSQRAKAGANQLAGAVVRLAAAAGTFITDVTYNPTTNQYLASWNASPGATFARLINADGTLSGNIITLSTRWKSNDALSVAYNTRSDSFFMVSHGSTCEDGGVEIAGNGTPVDNGFVVTATGCTTSGGNFYPRLAASTDDPNWLVSTANNFSTTMVQLVAGTAVVATSNPLIAIDTPGPGILQQPFMIAGWAADLASTSTSGADAVHVWAWPASGAPPIFVGALTPNLSRPDVGAVFGSRFGTSGFILTVNNLPGGSYLLAAYMHSTVAGKFNFVRTVSVTIADPLLSIDIPSTNVTVSKAGFVIGGWAIDRGAASGPGVDTVAVWAFPADGGDAVFAGVATYGFGRPDVGAAYGAQFTNSGYVVTVDNLKAGVYDVVVFSKSAVTGTYNIARVVHLSVQ